MPNISRVCSMSSDYLSYWKPDTARRCFASDDTLLRHAASNQYGKLKKGDTVWLVTTLGRGHLTLLGHIRVFRLTDQHGAEMALKTTDLWVARHHILAAKGQTQRARDIRLTPAQAKSLRFASPKDRLRVVRAKVDARQLQSMRRLKPRSVALLRRIWDGSIEDSAAEALIRRAASGGAGFGSAEANRKVERAAVKAVVAHMRKSGWEVQSVEADKLGYDLLCRRGDQRRRVEVKGVRGPDPRFIITENERRAARNEADFHLAIVTGALSQHPQILEVSGRQFLKTFQLKPLAHQARPS